MNTRTSAFVLSVLLSSVAIAQQGSDTAGDCPGVAPTIKPQELSAGPSTLCGSGGLTITIGLVSYTASDGFCPSFIDTIPEHGVPTPALSLSGYYIHTFVSSKPVVRDYYRCTGMLWWRSCEHDRGPIEIYRVDNSIAVLCGTLPPAEDAAGD